MDRIKKHLGAHLKPVTLYYDDIEQIVALFKQINNEVRIESSGYLLSDISELIKLNKNELNDLEISISSPHVSLDLNPDGIWLYAAKDDPIEVGLFEQLKQFLQANKRPLTIITQSSVLAGLTSGLLFGYYLQKNQQKTLYDTMLGLSIFILSVIWSWWSIFGADKRHTIIYPLLNRNMQSSFFMRNKEPLLISGISAFIGAIITILLTKLLS